MPLRFKVALLGFTEFERNALVFCIRQVRIFPAAYDLVDDTPHSDLIIADGDSDDVVNRVVRESRLRNTVFVGGREPSGAVSHLPRPIDPSRILLRLDELAVSVRTPRPGAPPASAPAVAPATRTLVAETAASAGAPAAEPPAARPAVSAEAQAEAKARARAAARRARLAHAGVAPDAAPPLTNVLVLDADEAALASLGELLGAFGFEVHAAAGVEAVAPLLLVQPFAAVFMDVALDGSDDGAGVDLCRRIKQGLPTPGSRTPPVFVMRSRARPADRVRASLAGADLFLAKPLQRGDVARALESCGVAMPSDARRH